MKKKFSNKNYIWKSNIDYRKHPEKYSIGKGEQGVLICQPYKSEILPHWKFKIPAEARISAKTIYQLFLNYLKNNDMVGADMARKYLQMGFTRSRRYANYKSGKKYDSNRKPLPKGTGDPRKIISANIFLKKWQQAERNRKYQKWKKEKITKL